MPDASKELPIHTEHGFNDAILKEFEDHPYKKVVVFGQRRFHYFLGAKGVRIARAQKPPVLVLDQALDAVNRTKSMADVHANLVDFINKRREEDREKAKKDNAGKSLGDLSQDEVAQIADGYTEAIAQMARTSFGELSQDLLLISMSATLWAGLLTFYPDMPLDYVDRHFGTHEVEAVQAQIQDDMLAMLESTKRAAKVNGQAREMTGQDDSKAGKPDDSPAAEQAEKN